ncbi:MAG: HEAT repeat domain-containing protein [Alkalinema sp. RL_2_19]|nr:HEAT repeat domain-containing protein [Alkalinema sp. RL_2_19]
MNVTAMPTPTEPPRTEQLAIPGTETRRLEPAPMTTATTTQLPESKAVVAVPTATTATSGESAMADPGAEPQPVTMTASIVPRRTSEGQMARREGRPIDGELVATQSMNGLARQTRLPQVGAVENLLKDIRSPDPAKRRKAIWDLGQWGDTRAVQPLVDLMLDADSKQRSLILSALSEIGTRTLKPMSQALAISLQDDSPDVRKNAIRDLTRVYDLIAQISQMVQKSAINDPDEEVRDTANWALKQLSRIRPPVMDENLVAIASAVSPPERLPAK